MTALIMACTYGFTDIAEYLMSEGADVNIQDTMYGYTALFGAAYSSKELVEILLTHRADIHIRFREETTAFTMSIFGALGGSVTTDVASMLLERGADINAEANDGATVLSKAMSENNPEMVTLLKTNGAVE